MTYPLVTILFGAAMAYAACTLVATLLARGGFPLPSGRRRIGWVDGLRGYLALSVLIHHFVVWLQVTRLGGKWEAPSVNILNELGSGAVAIFFMITGLVFYPRVLQGFRTCSWRAIYVGRLFRIVPMVVASVVAVSAIIAWRTGRGLDLDFPLAAASWITSWGEPPLLGYPDSGRLNAWVLWSLWYEWLFYLLVLPFCAILRDLTRGKLPSWTVPASLLALALLARILGHAVGFRPLVLMYLPLFAIGMLAYECQLREPLARRLRGHGAAILGAIALALGASIAPFPYAMALPLFGLFFVCVVCGNDFGGLLRTRGALVLGECSYSIYLLHGIVLSLLFVEAARVTGSVSLTYLPMLLPVVALLVAVLTSVSFLVVERPTMRLGRYLTRFVAAGEAPARTEAAVPSAPLP